MSKTLDLSEPAPPTIQAARPEDVPAIKKIAAAAGIDAWTEAQYSVEIGREDSLVLKALRGGELVGVFLGRIVPGAAERPDAEIYNIAVAANFRRQGRGYELLTNAITVFRSRHCERIWLEVRSSNRTAIRFYENNGFTRTGMRRNFYTNPVEDAIVMGLTLAGEENTGHD
jgi:[ribosomal protein S18]-alanine N-acetyltransferase